MSIVAGSLLILKIIIAFVVVKRKITKLDHILIVSVTCMKLYVVIVIPVLCCLIG